MPAPRNYIAELAQYPTHIKVMGYGSQEEANKRFHKSPKERAEIYALQLGYATAMKKEHGPDWKKKLRHLSRPLRPYNKTIESGTKVLAQWN